MKASLCILACGQLEEISGLIRSIKASSTDVLEVTEVVIGDNTPVERLRPEILNLANTYFPTMCLIVIVEMTLFIDDTNFDTNVMVNISTTNTVP